MPQYWAINCLFLQDSIVLKRFLYQYVNSFHMRFDGYAIFLTCLIVLFCFVPFFQTKSFGTADVVHGLIVSVSQLTHWGRKKMVAISQTIFTNAFFSLKQLNFTNTYCVCWYKNSKHRITMAAWQNIIITWYYVLETQNDLFHTIPEVKLISDDITMFH